MKMNRSKTLLYALAGFAAIMLAGCQSGGSATADNATTGGSPATAGKRFKIGISIPAADHGWTAGVKYWADQVKKDNPDVDWVIQDAAEPGKQITDLENMKTQGVDAVVLLPYESAALTPVAEKLHDAGILVVNVDRGLDKPVADVHVEGDNAALGRKSADFIVKKLNGKGKIFVLEGIPCTVNTDRVNAAKEVFKANPGVQILAEDTGMWNRQKAQTVVQNMLVSNPQVDAIWAADDDMALGAETALKAAGRDKNVWIFGGGCMKDIIKRMMDKDPMYPGDCTYPPSMIAFGAQTAAAILRAGKQNALQYTPRHIVLDVDIVTPENAKNYYFPDSVY
jgi:ribose transport system substrate-binding protein